MKLLFDLRSTQPDGNTKRHGGGKYGEIVLGRILQRHLPISCCYDSRLWINPEILTLLSDYQISLFDLSIQSYDEILADIGDALTFIPTNVKPYHFNIKGKVIGVFHGLRVLESPLDSDQMLYKPITNVAKYFGKKILAANYYKIRSKYYEKAFMAGNFHFLTVSNHSAFSFKAYFPECKDFDIPVFYSPSTSVYNLVERKYSEKYFLLVSANRIFKNNLRAIRALDRLFDMGYAKDFKVKITGLENSKGFWYKIKNIDKFDFVGFVNEKELDQLYHDAYCFIYPSLNEGFGYPPMEAMHYGVPVLSSPLSSIPEVCAGNVIYFNPFSVEEIMNRILMILNPDIHAKYSKLSLERYDVITKKQNEDLDRLIDYLYNYQV